MDTFDITSILSTISSSLVTPLSFLSKLFTLLFYTPISISLNWIVLVTRNAHSVSWNVFCFLISPATFLVNMWLMTVWDWLPSPPSWETFQALYLFFGIAAIIGFATSIGVYIFLTISTFVLNILLKAISTVDDPDSKSLVAPQLVLDTTPIKSNEGHPTIKT